MTRHPVALALILAVVLAAGCSRAPEKVSVAPAPEVPEFDPKRGLLLPEQTQRSLGLRIVDVEERAVGSSMELSLQVYASDQHVARAIGRVLPGKAEALAPGNDVVAHAADGTAITGKVVSAGGGLQKVNGAGEVLVEFPQQPEPLAAGQFVEARIPLAAGPGGAAVPSSALLECSEGTFVYALNGRYFVRTPVAVGQANSEFAEITDGLYEGDQVVAEPVLSLWMTEIASVKGGQSCCAVSPEER